MKDPPSLKRLAKLAVLIHDRLCQAQQQRPDWRIPEYSWDCVARERNRLQMAIDKGLGHAQAVQYDRVKQYLDTLQRDVQSAIDSFQTPAKVPIASPREILRDLLALHDEFPVVTWEPKPSLLSVTTESITLEGLYLGPFRIELDLRQLAPHPYYLVIAEEPQSCGRNTDVTHPHVEGDRLCEGEGTMLLRAAMRSGRVLDFFHIVNNLLHTYNSASPYVAISEWGGVVCSECDWSMGEDEVRWCERCDVNLCSECSRCCADCSETLCTNCSRSCHGCDDDLCRGCAKECNDCHEMFCSSCLQDDERCRSCHDEFQEQAEAAATEAALQSE